MRKFLVTLILMLFIVFSITNAHPFKNDKELQNFYAQIDKEVDIELKKDYLKLFAQRRFNLRKIESESFFIRIFEDDEYRFTMNDRLFEKVVKKNVFDNKFIISTTYYPSADKMAVMCLGKNDNEYYGTIKKFREDGTLEFSGQFYAGKMEGIYKEYYDSGKILKESYFSNDKKNGLEKIYYENGQISSIKNYKNGVVDGEYIEYYLDGKLKLKGSYKNGLRDGEFKTYLMNSKNAGSMFYKDGKEIKSTLTDYMKEDVFFNYPDKTEAQMDIKDKKDDYYLMYYLNNNKISSSVLVFFDDYYLMYYLNGRVMRLVPYNEQGLYDGTFAEYYESGQLAQKGYFKNGLEEGKFIWYYEDGNIKEKAFYKNGVKQ